MQNNQFKSPLLQSAAVVAAAVILIISIGSSGAESTGGGIVGLFSGIGNLLLFAIGMTMALGISIAILIGIFLAAVAMVDSEQASAMFADLKKNFFVKIAALNGQCCSENSSTSGVTKDEYEQLNNQIDQLQEDNKALKDCVDELRSENATTGNIVKAVDENNLEQKTQIDELNGVIETLQGSEKELRDLLSNLSGKIENPPVDKGVKDQLVKLESQHTETRKEIDGLLSRLNSLEDSEVQQTSAGIFSYIINEKDQALFAEKIEEAVILEMTYAQIDDHLAESLTAELDKIVKDHPTLTKTYIREVREANVG